MPFNLDPAQYPDDPPPAYGGPSPIPDPVQPVMFAADCWSCEWQGQPRPSSLAALRDFDRHKASAGHARVMIALVSAELELCPECGHASDIHDRRAEDSSCESCDADGMTCPGQRPSQPEEE